MASRNRIKLPKTVGPWFNYWIEYIPESELGVEPKRWFKAVLPLIVNPDPFGRRELNLISVADLTEFLRASVFTRYHGRQRAWLVAYFHSAMVAARNLGGADAYQAKRFFTPGQLIRRRVASGFIAFLAIFGLFISSLTIDRMIRKDEGFLTASASVLRENGFGVAVAFAEDVYYTYINPATVGGSPASGPNDDDSVASVTPVGDALEANNSAWGVAHAPSVLPERLQSPVSPIEGEGVWNPTKIVVNGNTAIWIARIRPDEVHTSYWATVTWFDPQLVAFAQVPGTKIPEVEGLQGRTGQVPERLKSFYVAGLNGGFLMRDSQGGYQFGDRVYKKLIDGKASLVTYRDGSLDVVEWGRDNVRDGIQSVRQNMELIVDGGVSQVVDEDQSKWGWVWKGVGSGKNLVWRSGVGVRKDGSVVYVIGAAMSAKSLGNVLVRAGAERAILLDMNEAYANGFLYGPYKNGKKLDSASTRSPERFWLPSERDFIAVYTKSPASRAD